MLGDIEIAQKMLEGKDESAAVEIDHPDDSNYKSLHCNLRSLDRASREFTVLNTYLQKTMGSLKLELQDIWAVDREGEVCTLTLRSSNVDRM